MTGNVSSVLLNLATNLGNAKVADLLMRRDEMLG